MPLRQTQLLKSKLSFDLLSFLFAVVMFVPIVVFVILFAVLIGSLLLSLITTNVYKRLLYVPLHH